MPEYGTFGDKLLAAFGWAGKHGRQARLHGVVDDAIKRHGVGENAQSAIMAAIDDDPALMVEMLDELKFRKPLVDRFMQKRISALRNQGVTIKMPSKDGDRAGQLARDTHDAVARPAKQDSSGQGKGETHRTRAAATGDGGQDMGDTHPHGATTPGEQNAAHAARGGQLMDDAHAISAPAPQHGGQLERDTHRTSAAKDGAGHVEGDTRCSDARPSTPTQTDRAAMIAARNKQARRVLDRASIMDGKPVGDCTKEDFENMVRRGSHWAQFARRVLAEAAFTDEHQTPLKRVMDDTKAQRLWTQAWEAVTHAA